MIGIHKSYSRYSKRMRNKVFLGFKKNFAIFADPDSEAAKKHQQRIRAIVNAATTPEKLKEKREQLLLRCAGGFAEMKARESHLSKNGWADQVYWDGEGCGRVWAIIKDDTPLFAIKMEMANYWDSFAEGRNEIKKALGKAAAKYGAKVESTYRICGSVFVRDV